MLRQNWTPIEEATLRELAARGVHLRKIALRLRRSESSVKKRAFHLGVAVAKAPRPSFSFERTWKR